MSTTEQLSMLNVLKQTNYSNFNPKQRKISNEIKLKTSVSLNQKRKRSHEENPSSNWQKFTSMQIKPNKTEHVKSKEKSKIVSSNFYSLIPDKTTFKGITPIVAVDCEMVQCETNLSELARVSIVNYNGHVILDQYVRPNKKITNFLTWVSGITYPKIKDAPFYSEIKKKIHDILKNKIIVGHSLQNDFKVLELECEEKSIRDIAQFKGLRTEQGKAMALKKMCTQFLNINCQNGQHDSIEDARATLLIYKKFEKEIEEQNKLKNYKNIKNQLLQDITKKVKKDPLIQL